LIDREFRIEYKPEFNIREEGQGDKGTEKQEDKGTGRSGDTSPCPLVPLSVLTASRRIS
jgi:hypothetical protein